MSAIQMLVYYSTATFSTTPETVITHIGPILKAARKNNPQYNLTGALFIGNNYFMQLLEGDREAISNAFTHIIPDTRHKDVIIVGSGPIKQRYFGKWSMGFYDGEQNTKFLLRKYMDGDVFIPSALSSADAFNFMLNLRDNQKLIA